MRFHGAALSGGLVLSSLSGAATQETPAHSESHHAQPSIRRPSSIPDSDTRRDSVLGMLKKFLPDVNSPVAFGFSNDRNSDERMQRNRDNWTSDSSSDGNPDEQPSDDTTPLHPVESATSKTMAFPRPSIKAEYTFGPHNIVALYFYWPIRIKRIVVHQIFSCSRPASFSDIELFSRIPFCGNRVWKPWRAFFTLPVELSVSNLASTSDAGPLPTVAQSVEPSILIPPSSTSLASIGSSAISGVSLSSADLPGPLSLPTAIIQNSAADGSTSDVSPYAGSTPTPNVSSSTYAYNVNPASNIATQNNAQLSSLASSGSNTQPSQTPAQQTSVDSTSQLTQMTSSTDSATLPTTTSSSYVQDTPSIDGSANSSGQPDIDESATSSLSLSEASTTIATSSETTMTQSFEQAASTSDTAFSPTTSVSDTSSSPSPDTSSDPEPSQGQATSISITGVNSNGDSSTTGQDALVASTTSVALQETISATLGLSLGALLSSDSISLTMTEIEATTASSEPTSLFTQSTPAGFETISNAYSIVLPSLPGLNPTSTDPILVSASTDGVLDSALTSVTSPDPGSPTSGSLVDSSDSEAAATTTAVPVISVSNPLSDSEASTSQEILASSVPVVGPVLNLLSSETSSVVLPLATSVDAVQTSSVDDSAESFTTSDILPSATTDTIPSETETLSYDGSATSNIGGASSNIIASTTFELSDSLSQVSSTEAALSSTYAISAESLPTAATGIDFLSTDLPLGPENVVSETELALPAAETQAALPTASLKSIDSLLTSVISDAQTLDVAQPSQAAVESSISSGEDQVSASLSAEVSIPTESVPGADLESATISGALPSSDIQPTEVITSDVPLDITTTVPDLDPDTSETSVLLPTSISVNQQVPDITTSVDELATALPGSSVDSLIATLTTLVSQELPTSTYMEGVSTAIPMAEALTMSLPASVIDNLPSSLTSLTSEDLPTSAPVDDASATMISDLPAPASSISSEFNDLSAAASSIVSETLTGDISQSTELGSSIVDDVTTDLSATASSTIEKSFPSVTSDVGAAATSLVASVGDVASPAVPDLPAAASSILSDFSDLPAATSSMVNEAVPSDLSQPAELVSSILDGVSSDIPLTTDLPAAASSTINGSKPILVSNAGASASSLVDIVSDSPAATSSSVSDLTDLPAAASSVVSQALTSDFTQPAELISSMTDGVNTDLPLATDFPAAAASSFIDGSVPTFVSDAGVAASSVVDNTGDSVSSIISSIEPAVSENIASADSPYGSLSITASADEIPVTSAGIDPTQVTESLVQITSISRHLDLSTALATTLIDGALTSPIPTVDVAESEITLTPTSVDLSAPSLVSGVLDSSIDLPQQTDEIGSIPSYSTDPSDPVTSEILPSIASDVSDMSMATSDSVPSATTDLSVLASFEATTNAGLLSVVESTAQVTSFDVSATVPGIAEPTYSQIDAITTGLDAAATSTVLDPDISTNLFGIEPSAAASLSPTSYGASVGDDTVSTDLSASSTTFEVPNVVDSSATAELSSSVESNVPQPVESDVDATSDILPSATPMAETLLTSAVDSIPSSMNFGSQTSIIESGSVPTQSAFIPSEVLENSTTIAGGDNSISSLVNEIITTTDVSDLLSTPTSSTVPDELISTDVTSIALTDMDAVPTSTMLDALSSELAPISSTLDDSMSNTASLDLSLTDAQLSTELPTQTTDVSLSDLMSSDIPTDPSQIEESIPTSTSMYITSISEMADESFPTTIPESSEPILTVIGAASTISEATATLAGDSSFYTDLSPSTQLPSIKISAPTASVSVDLGNISDPDEATSTSDMPSLSVTDNVQSIPTSAAYLDQIPTTSLADILSGLPTEIETIGLSATATLTDLSIALTESVSPTSAALPDIDSTLTEAIDSMTSTLDASITIPTAPSDILVSSFAPGAAQSEALVSSPTEASDDLTHPVESASIGNIETDAVAPSIVTSGDIVSVPITTDSPSLSTAAIGDLISSSTDLTDVTSILDGASPSTSIELVDPESFIPSSDVADVQPTTMPPVGSDVPLPPSAIATDALSSVIETATSQFEAISSALDYNSIATSSENLALATGTTLIDSSSIETSTPDVLDGSTILLPSDSQSLPTSTLDFGVSESGLPTDIGTLVDPTDAASSPSLPSSSIIDDESSVPTDVLAQPTNISDTPISTDDLSEASAASMTSIEATLDASTILPLVTEGPTVTSSDNLASMTGVPESTGIVDLDSASVSLDASSTIGSIDNSSVGSQVLPTSDFVDSVGSLATSVMQDASSIVYVDSSTANLGSLPSGDVADATGSPSAPTIILDASSAIETIDSSSVKLGSLPTSEVTDAASLPSITYNSDSLSDASASASTNIETTLDTSVTSVVDDLPSSTISDFLSSITPAPDLSQTSLSSIIEDDSSAMPSLIDSSDVNSDSQPTSALVDLPSSMTSSDVLSETAASFAASNEEVQQPTTIPSSTIDSSLITSSYPLPLTTATSKTGETSSLDTASDVLNSSSLDRIIGSSITTLEPELTSALAETTDLPSGTSPVDSEIYLPTEVVTQTTDSPSVTPDPAIPSETLNSVEATSVPITDESMVSSAISVLSSVVTEITDLPSSTISDLPALTTPAPGSLETGSDLVDISLSTQDDSSLVSVALSSAVIVSDSAPTSAISEVTDVPSVTLDSQSETSALPITLSEGITDISTSAPATDVPSSMMSAVVADSASGLIDTISASIVFGAAETSSSLINTDMVTPTGTLTQATDVSGIFASSATQSDISTLIDSTTETILSNDTTALPSSPVSSLDSEVPPSAITSLASLEATSTSVGIGDISTGTPSLSLDDASTIVSIPAETVYSASAATDLPIAALSSGIDLGVNISTSIAAAASESIPVSSSLALSTFSANSELLSSVTAQPTESVSFSIEPGYAPSAELPVTPQLSSSEEPTSTMASGLPTEIQTMAPIYTADTTDSSSSLMVSIPSTLSQSLGPDPTEQSSSVVDNTMSISATVQISTDPELSVPTSLATLSSVAMPLDSSMSAGETSSSAVTLSSLSVPSETSVVMADMTSVSSVSESISAIASSVAVTSQTLLDTTLANAVSTFAASAIPSPESSSFIDSSAVLLPSNFAASSQSMSTMEPSLSSNTVLPVQTSLDAATSDLFGSSSTAVQISDVVSQTSLSTSFVAPTSSLVQISATSLHSDDIISSVLQVVSSDVQSASSFALPSSSVSTYGPALGAVSSTLSINSAQTAISSSLSDLSIAEAVSSSFASTSGPMPASPAIPTTASVSNSISVSQLSLSASIAASSISPDSGLFSSATFESGSGILSTSISVQSSSSMASFITSSSPAAIGFLLTSSIQPATTDLISTSSILQSVPSSATFSSAINLDIGSTSIETLPGVGATPTPLSSPSLQSSSIVNSDISSTSLLAAASSSTTDVISGSLNVASSFTNSFVAASSQAALSLARYGYLAVYEHDFTLHESIFFGCPVNVKHFTVVEHPEPSINDKHLAIFQHCVTFERFAVIESTPAITEHLAIVEHFNILEFAGIGQFANFKHSRVFERIAVTEQFEHSIIVKHFAIVHRLAILEHRAIVEHFAGVEFNQLALIQYLFVIERLAIVKHIVTIEHLKQLAVDEYSVQRYIGSTYRCCISLVEQQLLNNQHLGCVEREQQQSERAVFERIECALGGFDLGAIYHSFGLSTSSGSASTSIGASVSSSATVSTGTTQSLVLQSSSSSLSSVSSLNLALSIAVPTSSVSTSQIVSSQANGASSSASSSSIPSASSSSTMISSSSSSSTISAASSSTTTGYLVNVGVGSTSVGVIQTAGGGNLVDVGAGSLVSTQISASAANPVTTAVGSVVVAEFVEPECFILCYDGRVIEHIRINSQLFDYQHIFTSREHSTGWCWQQYPHHIPDFVNEFEHCIIRDFLGSIAKCILQPDSLDFWLGHLEIKHGNRVAVLGATSALSVPQVSSATSNLASGSTVLAQSSSLSTQAASSISISTPSSTLTALSSGGSSSILSISSITSSVVVINPATSASLTIQSISISSNVASIVTPSVQIGIGLSSQSSSSTSAASIVNSASSSSAAISVPITGSVPINGATNMLVSSQVASTSLGSLTSSSIQSSSSSSQCELGGSGHTHYCDQRVERQPTYECWFNSSTHLDWLKHRIHYNISWSNKQQFTEYFDSSDNASQLKHRIFYNISYFRRHQSIQPSFIFKITYSLFDAFEQYIQLQLFELCLECDTHECDTLDYRFFCVEFCVAECCNIECCVSECRIVGHRIHTTFFVCVVIVIHTRNFDLTRQCWYEQSCGVSEFLNYLECRVESDCFKPSEQFVKPECFDLFVQCCSFVTECCIIGSRAIQPSGSGEQLVKRASFFHVSDKLQCCSVCVFVKSSILNSRLDNSLVKYDQHFSSFVHNLEHPKHVEAVICCFGNFKLVDSIILDVKGNHYFGSNDTVKCCFLFNYK
ncbi:hypothetical protein KCU85_g1869, partial [Aureobasidium melanogenum]